MRFIIDIENIIDTHEHEYCADFLMHFFGTLPKNNIFRFSFKILKYL